MDPLIGTRQCPHLGYDTQGGIPCCNADDLTRQACGLDVLNPDTRGQTDEQINLVGTQRFFCTVLGSGEIPAKALRMARQKKAQERQQKQNQRGYKPPQDVTGMQSAKPDRSYDSSEDPVIPTHTLRQEGQKLRPNDPCACGSGKKYKKCCGRFG